ncbi:DUF2334 domain-containing protein [Butyrivibrio sp. FCS014]|uniref:DUF2334 domain-containing protein n=1 Tax=Butyrivibrio sp. FCS014 TaxID=1408304 RepID=UPI000465203E|nr:DUF2334 domain-containing protein [Butyrivibrio sp. FCS014]
MRIAIRLDDITPGMNWENFLRFKEILDKHGVKPLIGVVPDVRDKKLQIDDDRPDFWNYVKELRQQGWIVAMHGFCHVYTTSSPGLFPIGGKSEFAGVSYKRQEEMIKEGKRILEEHGIETDLFMAPSHSFDMNTLKVLKENGFYGLTDGFGTGPFRSHGLVFYPISVSRAASLKSKKDGIVTFVYHTNTMKEADFEDFEKLFDRAEVVSFSEYKRLDVEDRTLLGEVSRYCVARAKYLAVQARKLIKK